MALRLYGEKVQATYGVGKIRQLLDLVELAVGTDLSPVTYYKCHLFQVDRRAKRYQYLDQSGKLLQVLVQRLPQQPDNVIFTDKIAFEGWCSSNGLRVVKSYTVISNDDSKKARFSEIDFPHVDLIVKPNQGRAGNGVTLWRSCSGSHHPLWENKHLKQQLNAKELIDYVRNSAIKQNERYLFQPRLINHPAVRSMGNGCLSTVRIMTVRNGQRRPALLLAAALRIPFGDVDVDNFDKGGLASGVDLMTGTCSEAIQKTGVYPLPFFDRNPTTQAMIKGVNLPFWKETVQLCIAAHEHLESQVPIIGWDVAILTDGPILIEANHLPGEHLVQMASGIPLGATCYPNVICNALCEAFSIKS